MDKYIKESELFKRILNVDFKHDYDGCIKFCQSIPAADVQEVRHGRWEEHIINNIYCEGGVAIRLTCPVCGECFTVTREARPRERFCRWCGAKMDEVSDEK